MNTDDLLLEIRVNIEMNIEMNPNLSNSTCHTEHNAQHKTAILKTIQNIIITTLLSLIVIAAQRLDYFWLENTLGEESITELLQIVFLLFTIVCFYKLHRAEKLSGAVMLVGGFFTTLLIRELDAYFDLIFHGFWLYPALVVTLFCIHYALRQDNLNAQMAQSLTDKYMQMLITFVVLLFVFSRLYGMGNFWEAVMGSHYVRDVKNISEETIELLFYAFIAFYAHKTSISLTQK